MNLLLATLLNYLLISSTIALYVYEEEHVVLDLTGRFGFENYSFEARQCPYAGDYLVEINRIIEQQHTKVGKQDWPQSPIVKTQLFESGDLDIKTGAFLTLDRHVHLFSDNSFNISNISAVLKLESTYQLPYEHCYDMRIYNQTLLALCLNDTVLFLDRHELYLQKTYQMTLTKRQILGLVKPTELNDPYYLELNKDYLALYQQRKEEFHLYQFDPDGSLDYLGFFNVSELLGEHVEILRVVFPYDDQVNYTSYVAVLAAKQGIIVLYTDSIGNVKLVDSIDPTPYGELYLDLYRQTDFDADQSILYLVSNNFIITLQVGFTPEDATAEILKKHHIEHLDNIVSYSVDSSVYYCLTHNETTGVDDFIAMHRNPLFRQLYIPNFTGSYFTYSVDNVLTPSLRNRLRVLTLNETSREVQVETYTFYRSFVNITASTLPKDVPLKNCLLQFKSGSGKDASLYLTVLRTDQKSALQHPEAQLNGNYIDLEVTKELRSYVDGPAPWFKIESNTQNLLHKQIYDRYSLDVDLLAKVDLVLPLIYSNIMSIVDDDVTNLRLSVLVIQDSNLTLAFFVIGEINGQVQTFDGKSFECNLTVEKAISFQEIVVVVFEKQREKVDIYRAEYGNIEYVMEYRPDNPFNDTTAKYHYYVMPGFPNLITILQEQQTEKHAISIQITMLPSSYSAFSFFQHLPCTHVILPEAFQFYLSFEVQFLGNGALIGRAAANLFQMFTVDLYMKSPSRLLSWHQAEPNSRIVFGFDIQTSRPILFEVLNGKAITYDIISLDADQPFLFAVGRLLPDFGFVLNESGLIYINNGIAVLEATRDGNSYLLAYQLNQTNFNSLKQVLPKLPNFTYINYDYPLSVGYEVGFCVAGFDGGRLEISCYSDPQLRLLMSPKSNDHIAHITISYGNVMVPEIKFITFGLNFVYEDIDLELIKPSDIYNSGSIIVLEDFFRGPIEDCQEETTPVNYLSRTAIKLDFNINDMCQHLSNLHNQKVSSKNWVVLLCGGGIWIIENNQNKTTKLSSLQLTEIWGNPIKQFLTSEKWAMMGYNDEGFYSFIKETASWAGNFTQFSLYDTEGNPFDLSEGAQRRILQFFVFVDLQYDLKLDFLLFQGYNCRASFDRTIGIYLSRHGNATHTQVYEFSASDISADMLDASQLNVSSIQRVTEDHYKLLLTFKSGASFLYLAMLELKGIELKVESVGRVDLSEELRKVNIVPHQSQLFEYEMLDINNSGCSFIVTTDFVIAGLTISFLEYTVQLETIYADYMGCCNQEMANQFGQLVALTCRFKTDSNLYLKVYHRSDSAVINITQFIQLPSDIGQREYLDRIGWNFQTLEYGILLESYPFETTNFTYYYYSINTSLAVRLDEHFEEVQLCCRNQYTTLCASLMEDVDDQTLFWAFIVSPLCMCFISLVGGCIYLKYYKQKMTFWAENYNGHED